MAYQATILPIMIASPGDVAEERKIIREVIHDWNDINSADSKIMLAAVGWDSHSSPELGQRPQELINSRILKNCDLLVGVFWTRLGTPTGKAESGTVEEIEEHIKAGKPAMIYFSSKPVELNSVDIKQFEQVKKFRKRCQTMGLVEDFSNIDEFRTKFSKQLPIIISKNPYLKSKINGNSEFEPHTPFNQNNSNNEYSEYEEPVEPQNFPTGNYPTLSNPNAPIKIQVASTDSTITYPISQDAVTLVKASAVNDSGHILKISTIGGAHIQAGNQQFGGENSREAARWESAIDELVRHNLVVAQGYKNQVFQLTHQGWKLADALLK